MNLTPGAHQLTAYANPPGSLFFTNVTSIFTNNAADTSSNTFDGNGQITQRVWLSANGQTNRIQTFTWDALNRLTKVSERDSLSNGYNWQTDFDPFGRRIRTTTVNVSNNIVMSSQPTTIVHYYDPQVEFLEIGVAMNGGLTSWKNYGPDLDGVYGSEQGLGGLESLTTGYSTVGLIQDAFGNVMGSVTNMAVTWNAARVDSYGAVDGHPALSFETAPLTAEHLAWRGKWRDMTGLYYWGARPYDSERQSFLSADPYGHDTDDSLYSAFSGRPTDFWDADARAPSAFQAFFPATAAAMGATPFTSSTGGDIAWVHGVVYPTMQLPLAPLMEPHVQGGLKVIGGAGETTAGGLGVATTSETGVGAYVSGLAIAHGVDTMQSGFRQMISGQQTPSFTANAITYYTGSPTVGEFGDAAIGTALTFGAGAYATPRVAALHDALQVRYTWGAPPGGWYGQGMSFRLRSQMGLVGTDTQLHHWLIPQNQWGQWIPNYIKNQPWNIMVMSSREAHAMIDTSFSVRGVTPYPLPVRLWLGTPAEARAAGLGLGLGTIYAAFDYSGGDVIMNNGVNQNLDGSDLLTPSGAVYMDDYSGDPSTTSLCKQPGQ